MSTPVPEGFALKEKIASLQEALTARHPTMATLLREIHTALKKQPENVTLLSPEDIRVVVNGLEAQTGIALAQSITKTSTSKTKSLTAKLNNPNLLNDL